MRALVRSTIPSVNGGEGEGEGEGVQIADVERLSLLNDGVHICKRLKWFPTLPLALVKYRQETCLETRGMIIPQDHHLGNMFDYSDVRHLLP